MRTGETSTISYHWHLYDMKAEKELSIMEINSLYRVLNHIIKPDWWRLYLRALEYLK